MYCILPFSALTEKIVVVLPRLDCPYSLEPHQIQGLDYINIFPVVQWLVKRSVESRAENAERLKRFAVDQFHNDFSLQSSADIAAARDRMLGNVESLSNVFTPKRRFRKTGTEKLPEEQVQVQLTILEYGNEALLASKVKSPTRQRSTSGSVDESEESQVDVAALIKNMSLTDDNDKLNQAIDFDDEARQSVFSEYTHLSTEFAKDDKEVEKQKQVDLLRNAQQNLERRLELLKTETTIVMQKKEEKLDQIKQAKVRQEHLRSELAALKEKHSTVDKELISKLTNLVQQVEDLKTVEAKFKKECTDEMQCMEMKIAELKQAAESGDDENLLILENELKDVNAMRLKLARKNRHIVVLQRQLDVPSRAELAQYQRRFLELYNQVNAKHRETKQFFTLYNTLGDTKLYMEKEINLLNSIFENFSASNGNPLLRAQFLKQFEAIVVGVKENKVKLQKRCQEEKQRKDKLNGELAGLYDLQRKYAAAIKEFRQIMQEKPEE